MRIGRVPIATHLNFHINIKSIHTCRSIDATLTLAVLLALLISAPLAAAAQSLDQLRLPPFYKGYVLKSGCLWTDASILPTSQNSIILTIEHTHRHTRRPPTEAPLVRARAMGAALGAWLGATLIPLDWGMPFQVQENKWHLQEWKMTCGPIFL